MANDVQYFAAPVLFPSGLTWSAVFSWTNARVLTTGTEILVTNADGSVTRIVGTGLAIDPVTGEPTGGTVMEAHRTAADGASNDEAFYFNATPPSLGDLRSQGLGTWLLSGDDVLAGNSGTDVLIGGAGNDTFYPLSGKDSATGGDGDDLYSIFSPVAPGTPVIIEANSVASGYDTVEVTDNVASFTLGANIEQLSHQSYKGAFKGTGNALDNDIRGGVDADTLSGLDGNDNLIGWEGSDTLNGGKGNDSFHVEDAGDKAVEAAGQGTDTVFVRGLTGLKNYTLAANIENIEAEFGYLLGAMALTGNSLANKISGSGFSGDKLVGLAGNDTLDGFSGADTLEGGTGNDTYVDNDGDDTITELAGQGTDTVKTLASTYTLVANIENLVIGNFAAKGTGNALANRMTAEGNAIELFGLDGDDTLDATVGAGLFGTMLKGGKGNDTYLVDGDASFDIVSEDSNAAGEGSADKVLVFLEQTFKLANFIENGQIADGTKGQARELTGNTLANILTGAVSDDTLLGSAMFNDDGAVDALKGGLGNDTYHIGAGDKITELAKQGTDSIVIGVSTISAYTLGVNVENLDATNSGVAVTGTGNTLANALTGSGFKDKLTGLAGDDVLSGGADADILKGGLGNDTYVLLSGFDDMDVFEELKNQGADTVKTDLAALDLTNMKFANIENVTGTGGGMHAFVGTAVNNVLTGDTNNDDLSGGAGNDQLYGLGDIDTLTAGDGNDTLDGGTDADDMFGGKGNDIFIVDDVSDNPFEFAGEGTDTIKTVLASYTIASGANYQVEKLVYTGSGQFFGAGNDLANHITGGALADILNGNEGADTLAGGKGDDTYIVDNSGDKIVEAAKQGLDQVSIFEASSLTSYTLAAANVENLSFFGTAGFTGTGNALDNVLKGDGGADKLAGLGGNDKLDGGTGTDELIGGLGNDTYIVGDAADKTIELAGQGTDAIETGLDTFSLADAARANIENLKYSGAGKATLTGNLLNNVIAGGGDADVIDGGDGNDTLLGLGGVDALAGGKGNDVLDGGTGADALAGGAGNDLYKIDDAGDVISEAANEGTADKAEVTLANTSWTMANNLEIATFKGVGNFLAAGNSSNNVITGGAGHDEIDGGMGNDTMTGLGGDDLYVVDAAGDKVVEAAKGGLDKVKTTLLTYTLGANVESLELMGSAASKGTGNALDNVLVGTGFNDTLIGLGGNDSFGGNGGEDTMTGGTGNDGYFVDSAGDVVIELAGQGIDDIRTSLNVYTLADNVEVLSFNGAGSFTATGNAAGNTIGGAGGDDSLTGLAGNDVLKGSGGADTLVGGAGNDTLNGGAGADRFTFADNEGQDVVVDFQGSFFGGADVLSLDGATVNDFGDLVFSGAGQNVIQQHNGTLIVLDPATSILLLGFKAADLQMADII